MVQLSSRAYVAWATATLRPVVSIRSASATHRRFPDLITLALHIASVKQGLKNLILKSVVATFSFAPISVSIAQQVTESAIVARIPPCIVWYIPSHSTLLGTLASHSPRSNRNISRFRVCIIGTELTLAIIASTSSLLSVSVSTMVRSLVLFRPIFLWAPMHLIMHSNMLDLEKFGFNLETFALVHCDGLYSSIAPYSCIQFSSIIL